jgi:hypothetical protein
MKNFQHLGRCMLAVAIAAAMAPIAGPAQAAEPASASAARAAPGAPVLRSVSAVERYELSREVVTRFGQPEPAEMHVSASGPFRFVNAPGFLYLDRTDTGSVGFENPYYGVGSAALEPRALARGAMLDAVDRALQRAGLAAEGRVFDSFHDEFEGAAQPDAMGAGFDPRQASRHVARTVAYQRQIDGLPVFGSELLVGLMPDGSIGRFRLHWPAIDAAVVREAAALRQAVQTQRWAPQQRAQVDGVSILDTQVGVFHTAFADPGFEVRAVVRVTERRSSGGGEKLALQSTGYRYYDLEGRELTLGGVPAAPGTPAELKGRSAR